MKDSTTYIIGPKLPVNPPPTWDQSPMLIDLISAEINTPSLPKVPLLSISPCFHQHFSPIFLTESHLNSETDCFFLELHSDFSLWFEFIFPPVSHSSVPPFSFLHILSSPFFFQFWMTFINKDNSSISESSFDLCFLSSIPRASNENSYLFSLIEITHPCNSPPSISDNASQLLHLDSLI